MQLGKKVVVFFALAVSISILSLLPEEGYAQAVSELLGDEDGFGFGTEVVPLGGVLPSPPPPENQSPEDPLFTDTADLPLTITYTHMVDLGGATPTLALLVINIAGLEPDKSSSTISVDGKTLGVLAVNQGELGSGIVIVPIFATLIPPLPLPAGLPITFIPVFPLDPGQVLADGLLDVTIVNGKVVRKVETKDEVYYDFSQLLVFSAPSRPSSLTSMWWRSSTMPVSWSRPTSAFWESMIAFSSWP